MGLVAIFIRVGKADILEFDTAVSHLSQAIFRRDNGRLGLEHFINPFNGGDG